MKTAFRFFLAVVLLHAAVFILAPVQAQDVSKRPGATESPAERLKVGGNVADTDDSEPPQKRVILVTYRLPDEQAYAVSAFLKDIYEYVEGGLRLKSWRERTPAGQSPVMRLDVSARQEFHDVLAPLIHLLLIQLPKDTGPALLFSQYSKAIASKPSPESAKATPPSEKLVSTRYHSTPKRIQAIALLLSRHAQVPLNVKHKLDTLELSATPDTHKTLASLIDFLHRT